MKIQGGNIDKTEDKIIRVDGVESEDASTPFNDILGVNRLLPPLSILQLSDVGLKTKKTFKGKAGKVLVVGPEEKSIEFGEGGGGNATPIILEYAPELTVDLGKNLNYILTLTGDCNLTLENIIEGYEYQFLIIQDNVGGHTLNIAHPCYYQVGYTQDTTPNSHSKLIIDKINNEYYASISRYEQLIANITWEDYDGTVLYTSTTPYGDTPMYAGPAPTRAGYIFNGWSPSLGPIFGDITYTATYEHSYGIFWNQNDGLISISSDGTNWITISDKNVGATQVYNDLESITLDNCGYMFQWGNCSPFPNVSYIDNILWTTTLETNAMSYLPSTYYNNAAVKGLYWMYPVNYDLWGGETLTDVAMKGPCQDGFHVPTYTEASNLKNYLSDLGLLMGSINVLKRLKMGRIGEIVVNSANAYVSGVGAPGRGYYRCCNGHDSYKMGWFSLGNDFYYPNLYSMSVTGDIDTANLAYIRPFKNVAVIPDYTWEKLY